MSHAYTEDQLVEQPAIELLAELGWSTIRVEGLGCVSLILRGGKTRNQENLARPFRLGFSRSGLKNK